MTQGGLANHKLTKGCCKTPSSRAFAGALKNFDAVGVGKLSECFVELFPGLDSGFDFSMGALGNVKPPVFPTAAEADVHVRPMLVTPVVTSAAWITACPICL